MHQRNQRFDILPGGIERGLQIHSKFPAVFFCKCFDERRPQQRLAAGKGKSALTEQIIGEPDSGNILNNQNKSYGDDIDNIFPYSFGDWDNFDFNIALNYCFCDILGMDRPDLAMTRSGKTSPMTDQAMIIQRNAVKVDVSVMEQELGRFGNVIYR